MQVCSNRGTVRCHAVGFTLQGQALSFEATCQSSGASSSAGMELAGTFTWHAVRAKLRHVGCAIKRMSVGAAEKEGMSLSVKAKK